MIKIAIANQKGGVGKTTISYNLSKLISKKPKTKVLVIDNDPQGNLTSSFLKDHSGLKANIINAYRKNQVLAQKITNKLSLYGSDITLASIAESDFEVIFNLADFLSNMPYDYCIIDSLPSFGHLHLASLTAANYILIPVKLAPYALMGLKDLFETIEKVKRRLNKDLSVLGIVINQIDGRNLIMEREIEELLREKYGRLVFNTKIRKRVKIEESPAFQKDITEYDKMNPAIIEFRSLLKEMFSKINENGKGNI